MRLSRLLAVSVFFFVVPAGAFAGDPIPDVDVILEQVPGGLVIEVPNGAPFDRFTLGGSREFVGGLEPKRLPEGWVMAREGRRVVLSGPVVSGPTRIALGRGKTTTKTVDWEVSLAGRELARRKNVVPRSVPQRVVKNSLQGIVVMPERVSPGEAVALRPLPGAELPPGRFVLSGVVMEPVPADADSASPASSMAIVNTTRSNIRRSFVTVPRGGFELAAPEVGSCSDLVPLAAALVGAGASGECASCKSFHESRSNTASRVTMSRVTAPGESVAAPAGGTSTWDVALLRGLGGHHDTAKGTIRNIKALAAISPGGPGADAQGSTPEGRAAFTVDPKRTKFWDVATPDGPAIRMQVRERGASAGPPPSAWVAFEMAGTPSGCRVSAREPDLFDLAAAMQAEKPRHDRPEGKPDRPATSATAATTALEPSRSGSPRAPLAVGLVPEDAVPGTALALQYVDIFGDLVVDVPAVPGTEIVPPPADAGPPCIDAATAFAQAEDTVCVCGHFPGAAAQAGLWLDEREAGEPVSLSSRTLQFQLPGHGRNPGRHVWSGDPEAGFVPSCRAWTQVVEIAGELDSQRLFSGQSTPMRLSISGTTERVPIRIRNLSPAIVTIDGGPEQTVESSGGTPNTVTRSVQGLVRGNFNIEWSLATDRCPCP